MNERLHIIITGDSGTTLKFPLVRKKLLTYTISAAVVLSSLTVTSIFSVSLFTKNISISQQLATLQDKVDRSDATIADITKKAETEKERLKTEIAALRLDKANQLAAFKEEKELLLSTAVSELNERSGLIETIMDNIGIKIEGGPGVRNQNSGGPFIEQDPGVHDELLYKADSYLKTIQAIPLGSPVKGQITSRFGKRQDPVNGKASFHEGIDFRGKRGEHIYATADGVVVKALRNGSYGNFVMIDHQNGYTTSFAHMQSYAVKKGERVKRGQLIGRIGNTGRSTGPHLHYEMLYKGKPVNPQKYLQIAQLAVPKKTVKVLKSSTPGKVVVK